MAIELLIDPNLESFTELQRDLQNQINALEIPQAQIVHERIAPPEKSLFVDEVVRFVITYKEEILTTYALAKILVELAEAARDRWKVGKGKDKAPPMVIMVDKDNHLEIPSSTSKTKKFLSGLPGAPRSKKRKPSEAKPPVKPKRSARKRRNG